MITILKEVTDWGTGSVSNGTYYVNDYGYLVAYTPANGVYKKFKEPIKQFSKARRKFENVGTVDNGDRGIAVEGSNGNTYYIKDGKCTCPGFKFRGSCKHL